MQRKKNRKTLRFSDKSITIPDTEVESRDDSEPNIENPTEFLTTTDNFQYKTKMSNGFDYYVKINKIVIDDNRYFYECTLKQVTDNSQSDETFTYPPRNKEEREYFWKNLKKRSNSYRKKSDCEEGESDALKYMKLELSLLEKTKAVPTKDAYFESVVYCDEKSTYQDWWNKTNAQKCLEGTTENGKCYRVTGKIVDVTNLSDFVEKRAIQPDVIFILYTLNDLDSKPPDAAPEGVLASVQTAYASVSSRLLSVPVSFNSPKWFKPGQKYTIPNNSEFNIWKNYLPISEVTPLKGLTFTSKISCDAKPVDANCLKKSYFSVVNDDAGGDAIPVLGIITNAKSDNKYSFLLYKKDDFTPLVQDKTHDEFELIYNPDFQFWNQMKIYDDDGSSQPGTQEYTKETAEPDGDCFYHALYDSLNYYKLLSVVNPIIGIRGSKSTDADFIVKFREYLSKHIEPELRTLIDSLADVNDDKDTFHLQTEGIFYQTVVNILRNVNKDDANSVNDSIKQIKNFIKTRSNWVSQIEVAKICNILKDNGIFIVIKINTSDSDEKSNNKHATSSKESVNPWKETSHFYPFHRNRIILVNESDHYYWYKNKNIPEPTYPTKQPNTLLSYFFTKKSDGSKTRNGGKRASHYKTRKLMMR